MEEQDNSALRLSDEQLAEVRRRRAKKNPNYVSLAEAREVAIEQPNHKGCP